MIVFITAHEREAASQSTAEIAMVAQAATLAGCAVYYIPPDLEQCETAANALWHVPAVNPPHLAMWMGFIPALDYYAAIYEAALAKGLRLLNNPQEHRRAMEFAHFYPLLRGLTPESMVVASPDEAMAAAQELGFPLFLKGNVKSAKDKGIAACVAHNVEELIYIVGGLLHLPQRSRGQVVLRCFIPLRHTRTSSGGFPAGREFRVFLYAGRVLEYGYYWDGEDDLAHLSQAEESAVLDLAVEASRRLAVPFVAIDIGQAENGAWIVVEVNDAQFAGHSQIPLLRLWRKLAEIA